MVTIKTLEVRFDVEGDSDDEVFARLFNKYIQRWNRLNQEQQSIQRMVSRDRALGDNTQGGHD